MQQVIHYGSSCDCVSFSRCPWRNLHRDSAGTGVAAELRSADETVQFKLSFTIDHFSNASHYAYDESDVNQHSKYIHYDDAYF